MKKDNKWGIITAVLSFLLIAGGLTLDFVMAHSLKNDPNSIGHWVPTFIIIGFGLSVILWIVVSLITLFLKFKSSKHK